MRIFTCLAAVLLLVPLAVQPSVVNNSASSPTAEDSLSVVFFSLDSLGNPTTADSVFVLVTAPGGTVAFRDSMTVTDSRVSSITVGGKQFYIFAEQVSNIDGSGTVGVYNLALTAKKNNLGLLTPGGMTFQIISTEFSDQIALLSDSVLVKGGVIDTNLTEQGGGADSASMARWVWNTPQANHTASGTFGKYLDTEVSGVSGGSGAYSITLVAYDTVADQAISGTRVAVRGVNQSSLVGVGTTNSNGEAAFNLDADSFVIVASSPGFVFSAYDTLAVTGVGVDTVKGYQFNIATPSNPNVCRVYGYLRNVSGKPESGATVVASLPDGIVTCSGYIVSPFAITKTTDSLGLFMLDLLPSSTLSPPDTKYEITISLSDGTILRQSVTVPEELLWQLTW